MPYTYAYPQKTAIAAKIRAQLCLDLVPEFLQGGSQ